MRCSSPIRSAISLACLGLIACSLGCTANPNANRAKVKGQVTLGEKALTAGTIEFKGADNRVGVGNIDADGNYLVPDAPIGDVKIAITVPKIAGLGAMMAAKKGEGKAPAGIATGDGGQKMMMPAMDPAKIVQIPDKYSNADTSGLTYKVVAGDNAHNIKLTP